MQRLNLKNAFTLLSCTAALTACDPLDTLSTSEAPDALSATEGGTLSQNSSGFGLSPPPMLQSRAVVRTLLRPRVTLGGAMVEMNPSGEQYVGSFSLPPDTGSEPSRYPLDIEWRYDIRGTVGVDSDDIILAQAPQQIITSASNRQIRAGQYSTDFDEDDDGTTNLAELDADRDPLTPDQDAIPIEPNDGQADCRDLTVGLFSRGVPVIRLSELSTDLQAITRANGFIGAGQAFFVEVQGRLTIDRESGLPEQGGLALFDRAVNTGDVPREIVTDNVPPLSVSAQLMPGLYCMLVGVTDFDNDTLSDVVLRYTFQP